MKCGFCNIQGMPASGIYTFSGQRMVVIYCRGCGAIFGAASKD
jgi:hypothetical protein